MKCLDCGHYLTMDEVGKIVATDIGETLCILAGNLMLEEREAGYLLARQLQPIMDYLKTKYIPDLPRLATVETIINHQVDEARESVIGKINKMLEPIKLHLCWITEDGNPEVLEYSLADEDGDEIDIATVLKGVEK